MEYGDANFIVALYLSVRQNAVVDRLTLRIREGLAPPLPMTWLLRAEVLNAFYLSLFAAKSDTQPHVTLEQALLAGANFSEDLESGFFHQREPAREQLEDLIDTLIARHTAKHGFRTYDIVHVASALALGCKEFWTFDVRAAKLARLEGLRVSGVQR